MIDITKLDKNKITKDGRYMDIDVPIIFDLPDDTIKALRIYHNDTSIACERLKSDIKPNGRMVVTREQPYNNGHHRTKGNSTFRRGAVGILVGSIIVAVVATTFTHINKPEVDKNVVIETQAQSSPSASFDYNVISYIKEASEIYGLDYNILYNKLYLLTEGFSSDDYLSGRIPGVTCKGENVVNDNPEHLIILGARAMSQLPENFRIDTDGFYVEPEFNDDYMSMIDKSAEISGVDRCLIYAIIRAEGGFDSERFLTTNNPGGLMNNGKFRSFNTKYEGIIEEGLEIRKMLLRAGYHQSDTSEKAIEELGLIYAPSSDGNIYWLNNVLVIFNEAKMKENELFGIPMENIRQIKGK